MHVRKAIRSVKHHLRAFQKDEDGNVLILSVFFIILMTLFGGMAVDVAHYERNRTEIQSNLDNAVLAAASLTQPLDAEEIVRSYLRTANLDSEGLKVETSTEVVSGVLVGRTVEASIHKPVSTFFMRLLGSDALDLNVASQASERIEDIEISLVLDVSGSMALNNWGNTDYRKINSLKEAAKGFVNDVLTEAEKGRVSISLIPYSTKVNAGEALLEKYNATQEHDYSNCIDFAAEDFRTTSIDPSQSLQRTGHFQFQSMNPDYRKAGQWTCRIDDGFEITPLSQSVDYLSNRIDALRAEGSTSIDMGVKWGAALLDPYARQPVLSLINENRISSDFLGRPSDFRADNTLKVLVIMTDGNNDTEYRLASKYSRGDSDLRWSHNNEALSWPEVWDFMSPCYYDKNYRNNPYSSQCRSSWLTDASRYSIDTYEKDRRLEDICSALESKGVVTYSIGFEVDNQHSLDLLKQCASTEAHYFDVEGLELDSAFDMIASSISMLRLTK